ncbi:hypothetical protein D3273_01150 [Lichenibacterium minor]|uniref:HNH endonuclease 5 domain-containing protein n=1 Tax=Lichenibacterium minor TaxID=2316528 RepID=A0A4Q2UCR3_9HYPH|nr:HNH endonuclease [Lichenibacterium minor]RYC33888.1 hypothetical protein D3273_01150 [Lichenibacterium minor]
MAKCILCQTAEVGHGTKPEHVLNDALGGRRKTRWAICSACNGKLGSTVDKAVAEQVKPIRNMFSMASGNGEPAPTIRVTSGDMTFDVLGDGRLRLVTSKPFNDTLAPDGTFSLQITGRSEDDIARSFAHAAAKRGMTVEELISKIAKVTGVVQDLPPGSVGHQISFGGLDCSRMMMKSALVLWCTAVGNDELHKGCYDDARHFALNGDYKGEVALTTMDDRYVEGHAALAEAFGPLFNYIAVASDTNGRVKAYFGLYNLYALCLTLAPSGGIAEQKAVLVSNPLDPGRWSDDIGPNMSIDAAWMDAPHWSEDHSGYLDKLNKMGAFHQQFSRERMIKIEVEDRWRELRPDGLEVGSPEGHSFIGELSHAISHNVLGLPRSKPFTIDNLMQIVRRKGEN